MKKFTILWSVLTAALCIVGLQASRVFGNLPMPVSLNWFRAIPAFAAFSLLVGYLVRKELKAVALKTRNAQEAGTFTGRPLARPVGAISIAR